MTQALKIGDRTISTEELMRLLAGYQMLPQLWREMVIDQAIAHIECTAEEKTSAYEQFCQKKQLTTAAERQAWLKRYGMSDEQLQDLTMRDLKIAKFKQATWGPRLESYFLTHKSKLDKVIYSLLRTQDPGVAQELYFRIQAGEQSFIELAREYSQGPEAQTGGLIGPVELSTPHPKLAKMLSISQPGQIWPPTRIGQWLLIVRLEKFIPAQLDEPMRAQLLHQLFEAWLTEQINQNSAAHLEGNSAVIEPK